MSHLNCRLVDSTRCKSSPALSPTFFAPSRRTACEQRNCASGNDGRVAQPSGASDFVAKDGRQNDDERAKIQAEIERLRAAQEIESCPSCLYVGVATSLGLAAYFAQLAMEKVDERTLSEAARRQQRYNKPVFLAFSVGWVAIGAYRWRLG